MGNRSKLLLAGLTAALVLAMGVTSASAQRLSISNSSFRATFDPLILSGESLSEPIRCDITMEGSFHSRTITKTVGSLIGYVTRAGLNACEGGGTATISQEALPWHIRYRGFAGALPAISRIVLGLIGAKFAITDNGTGLTCTTQTTATNPAIGYAELNTTTGVVTRLTPDPAVGIPLMGSFLCAIGGRGFFESTNTIVRLLGSNTTQIIIRLI